MSRSLANVEVTVRSSRDGRTLLRGSRRRAAETLGLEADAYVHAKNPTAKPNGYMSRIGWRT